MKTKRGVRKTEASLERSEIDCKAGTTEKGKVVSIG